MDINLLVLNLGNSRLGIGTFIDGKLDFATRIPHGNRTDWAGKIADAWARIKDLDDPAIAGASVHPLLIEPLEHAVMQATHQRIEWVGRDIEVPIKVATESPKETGVDRILNVAAAYELIGKSCAVVDAGTALTVDVCDDQGTFLGGAIAPGAAMMLAALHEKTAKLPVVALEPPRVVIGNSTEQAMLQGVYTGIRGMVKELVESYATHLGRWPDLIATGGDAETLFKGWELVHAISPDLVLYGIALAYSNHRMNQDE
jgi:type III pantothenate kinase